ncbi:MAG: TatD family deoxyribonuclease, partial [Spirochaetia bacterium]|nr:TatD family deoxyribonuclease [Spirochaetia bacterium]
AVAIGEIGLDNYHKYGTVENQEYLLQRQIELANQMEKPVIFHNREADDQFIALLERTSFAKKGIFHCYQGSEELARLAIEQGFYLSFAGPLTYKANKAMQELFVSLPIEHLLLETDSPYLSPNPVRGTVNTPLSMHHIYTFAAQLRTIPLEVLVEQVRANFHAFLDQ